MSVEEALREARIRELPLSPATCVEMGTRVGDVLELMKTKRAHCVLVCEGEHLRGIFTERDVVMKVLGLSADLEAPIESFMTPSPVTLHPEERLWEAMRLMDEGGYRHIPLVVEGDRVAGVVSVQDVIAFLAEHFPAEVFNLPPRSEQVFAAPEGA
ncbi:MAG: CBS domain-containing protein [Blastocatellia bacterium]|nr:CBS domain-containing protein [Blastocatellia bacterium]MCS7156402.1 CBS domain-containing protein [Blastocatellia bacterium]MCX7751247.1 CBS domain-containing protein [Blastocatellia bacterium]MDW8168958.1 CBS domain-containing protein [Acidobacteriota bacterium]MDW8256719.1 CBS domain-containing protein [Acidobacteriota bacterium]